MPKPVIIARCEVILDPDKKSPPIVHCKTDRERTANPKLLAGLVCETEFSTFERGGKQVQRWEVVCAPPMKIYRRLHHALNPNVIEELRDRMRSRTPQQQSAPPKQP